MYRYSKSHLLDMIIASIVFIGLMFLFHETSLDEWGASHFYSATKSWIYRDNFFLEKIFHKGGVIFTLAVLVALIGRWIYFSKDSEKKIHRDYIGFVVIASTLTIVLVFLLKGWTALPCPWNSLAFGGAENPLHLWQMFSMPHTHCFPSGHSSGGYAFLSMYFGHTLVYGKRNFLALLPGIVIGLVFGLTQQIRGAHFISHDFATIFITILCSWITSLIYYRHGRKQQTCTK